MSRDKIKIVEFGVDDDGPSPPAASGDRGMKIIEFDNEPGDGGKRVATAKDVGQIKIIEFDDEPRDKKASPPEPPRQTVGAIKIKEFGKEAEAEAREPSSGERKIKIVEFD